MGKRKERRLAAKIGAGRRVKLDLFVEPPGELGGSSAKDEVGEDMDAKIDTELPNSPSSSGHQPENPLSLLGQYSDDELDDISNKTDIQLNDDKVDGAVGEQLEEGEIGGSEDLSSQKPDNQDLETAFASAGASQVAEADSVMSTVTLDEKCHEISIDKTDDTLLASDTQTAEAINSSWKMVLHEESNRYYYWNTVTGETSWEVPDNLVQGTALTNEIGTLGTERVTGATEDINNATASGIKLDDSSARHGVGCTNGTSDTKALYEQGAHESQYSEQDEYGNQLLGSSAVVGALASGTSTIAHYSLPELFNAGVVSSSAGSYEVDGQSTMRSEHDGVDLYSHLVTHCEALLEKLKSLQRSGINSDEHVWSSKYMLEIEVRLSDIRTLLPYGSSLVPFWVHSERQLNQLENAVNSAIEKQNNKINGSQSTPNDKGKEVKLDDRREDHKVDEDMARLSPNVHDGVSSAVLQEALPDGAPNSSSLNVPQISVHGPSADTHFGKEGDIEISGTAVHREMSPKPEFQAGEDVDMDIDIDMEVESQSPERNTTGDIGGQLVASSEPLLQTAPTVGQSLAPESEFIIPPPPEEEWIPPPPPDNEEGIPPPPPDEPPDSFCPPPPPSEPEPVQSVYNEQYNLTYAESDVNYYGNTSTLLSGSTFYEHADGSQIAPLNLPVYYATVSNSQPTAVLSPADAAAYYGLQNGALPVAPLADNIQNSSFQAVPSQLNCDPLSSGKIASVDAEACTLSNQFVDPLASGVKTDTASIQASPASAVSPAVTVSVSVPPSSAAANSAACTSAAVSEVPAAVSKAQSKASRIKKPKVSVASSFRSNKKVSSLVDKWKAAKEELQEEEEEEETPLQMLEKKRRREIEEWRAQQIASGEAKENANFQPLGGDWRERIKRRRARKEAAVEKSLDAINDGTKQPDLGDLSKDLPPGWQALWDDSSRQVYYANSITSDTTWTRPTK